MGSASIFCRRSFGLVALAALVSALVVGSASSLSSARASSQRSVVTARALVLHDAMRALWEEHGTWTERAIVDFVGGLPDTTLVVQRLLQNQVEIGNAIKPYYGWRAGNQLTALLKTHIMDAVAVLQAAKSGDAAQIAKAKAAFYANGNQVARFLHAANPKHWLLGAMRTMMRVHLNQVITLAVDQLTGQYQAAIEEYDVYIDHILDMADMLSEGIVEQFPARFA
jgi:hypothetical protein